MANKKKIVWITENSAAAGIKKKKKWCCCLLQNKSFDFFHSKACEFPSDWVCWEGQQQLGFIAELCAAGSFLPAGREERILIWYSSKEQ